MYIFEVLSSGARGDSLFNVGGGEDVGFVSVRGIGDGSGNFVVVVVTVRRSIPPIVKPQFFNSIQPLLIHISPPPPTLAPSTAVTPIRILGIIFLVFLSF